MFSFGRRVIDLAVLFLALYALAVVPLGHRTGLEHLRAILGTRAARDAGRDLERAAERLGRHLLGQDAPAAPVTPHGRPEVPALPHRAPANALSAPASSEGPDASADPSIFCP